MLLTLGACNSRAGTAAREYALRYPSRRDPDANVFRRLEQHLLEKGSVTPTDLTPMDSFPVGTPEGASPSQDYRRSRGKTSSNCDNG
jgi:hypothetical protein